MMGRGRSLAGLGVAMAMIAGAMSSALGQGRGASAIRVTVGGAMEQSFGYATNRDGVRVAQSRQTGTSTVVLANPNRWGQQSDSEIWFSGRARLESGLVVGFKVELEGNSQFSDQIDESYLFVEGGFGRLVLGAENDAAYLMHVSAPRPGDGWGVLESAVTGWVNTPRSMYFLTTTAPLSTGDDQKLSYFTPRLHGVQAGFSFTPNDKQDVREFSDRARDRTNMATAALNGRWTWAPVSLGASIGWVHGAPVSRATFADRRTPLDDLAAGAELRFAGWSAGGGIRWLRNPGSSLAGRVLAAGVAKDLGDAAVGVGAIVSRTAGLATTPGRDRGEIILISGSYKLAPGVSAIAAAFAAEFSAGPSRTAAEDNNRGVGLVTGLRLAF
ncbi:MAG: porin [Alphaproteobacteria bacterium]|nr:porin [Alphaproteobacteria bacterium]